MDEGRKKDEKGRTNERREKNENEKGIQSLEIRIKTPYSLKKTSKTQKPRKIQKYQGQVQSVPITKARMVKNQESELRVKS